MKDTVPSGKGAFPVGSSAGRRYGDAMHAPTAELSARMRPCTGPRAAFARQRRAPCSVMHACEWRRLPGSKRESPAKRGSFGLSMDADPFWPWMTFQEGLDGTLNLSHVGCEKGSPGSDRRPVRFVGAFLRTSRPGRRRGGRGRQLVCIGARLLPQRPCSRGGYLRCQRARQRAGRVSLICVA